MQIKLRLTKKLQLQTLKELQMFVRILGTRTNNFTLVEAGLPPHFFWKEVFLFRGSN